MDNIDSERTDSWMDKLTAGRQACRHADTHMQASWYRDRQADRHTATFSLDCFCVLLHPAVSVQRAYVA